MLSDRLQLECGGKERYVGVYESDKIAPKHGSSAVRNLECIEMGRDETSKAQFDLTRAFSLWENLGQWNAADQLQTGIWAIALALLASTINCCYSEEGHVPDNSRSGRWHRAEILKGHTDKVRQVFFCDGGNTLISAGFDKTIRVWDVKTKKQTAVLVGHQNRIEGIAATPDGRTIISHSSSGRTRIWSRDESRCTKVLDGCKAEVSLDGRHIVLFGKTGSKASSQKVFLLSTGEEVTGIAKEDFIENNFVVNDPNAAGISWRSDGKSVNGSFSLYPMHETRTERISMLEVSSGKKVVDLDCKVTSLQSVVVSSDKKRILMVDRGYNRISLWDGNSGMLVRTLAESDNLAGSEAVFSGDGRYVCAKWNDPELRIFDGKSGALLHVLLGFEKEVWCVAFSPRSNYLAVCGESNGIELWTWPMSVSEEDQPTLGKVNSVEVSQPDPPADKPVPAQPPEIPKEKDPEQEK